MSALMKAASCLYDAVNPLISVCFSFTLDAIEDANVGTTLAFCYATGSSADRAQRRCTE